MDLSVLEEVVLDLTKGDFITDAFVVIEDVDDVEDEDDTFVAVVPRSDKAEVDGITAAAVDADNGGTGSKYPSEVTFGQTTFGPVGGS